jgi:LAO/AO transport system kinase
MAIEDMVAAAVNGDQRSIAKLLTEVEGSLRGAASVVAAMRHMPRKGTVVGFFGPPGVGKSLLIGTLVPRLRHRDLRVAIVANDPSSALNGGAILGDRVRMVGVAGDAGVFIRSVAARDPLRSLSASTISAVDVLARLGFDRVLVEAVGAGQSDLGTSLVADTNVLVVVPGQGDDVQAMKSGSIQFADVIAVNRSDAHGARNVVSVLRQAARNIVRADGAAQPKVISVSAATGNGIDELLEAIEDHGNQASEPSVRANRLAYNALADLVLFEVSRRARLRVAHTSAFPNAVQELIGGGDIATAALMIADELLPWPISAQG